MKHLLLLIVLLVTVPISARKKYRKDFLYREGNQLMLNGKSYQAAGFNAFTLTGCGHPWEVFTPSQMDSLFNILPQDFIIRTWAFPGNATQTDGIIATARKHHVKVIISLGDGRSSCGHFDGAPNGDNSGKRPEWYQDGYQKEFLPHVIRTVDKYKNDPTIAMWELLNEPGEAEASVLAGFIDKVGHVIKEHDPNHLTTVGCYGPWAYGGPTFYQSMFKSPYIDVGHMHEYDYDYKESNQIESPHFKTAMRLMNELNKPLMIGETGIESGPLPCRTSIDTRVEAMRKKFDVYLQGGACIVLAWNLVHEVRSNGFSFPSNDPLLDMIRIYPTNSHR